MTTINSIYKMELPYNMLMMSVVFIIIALAHSSYLDLEFLLQLRQ